MKNLLYILLLSPLFFVSSCEEDIEPIYEIGELAEGGIVFYIDATGEHGLVSAMEDLIEGATDPWSVGYNGYEWGCYEESVNGADGISIGTGYQNTMDIVNQGCETEYGAITAAQAAFDAEINSYSDWYLPSKDELVEIYNTIGSGDPAGSLGGFNGAYWSSSEDNSTDAWFVDFGNGYEGSNKEQWVFGVRVIRSF